MLRKQVPGALGAMLIILCMSLFNFGGSQEYPKVNGESTSDVANEIPSTPNNPQLNQYDTVTVDAPTDSSTTDSKAAEDSVKSAEPEYVEVVRMVPQRVVVSCDRSGNCRYATRMVPQRVMVEKSEVESGVWGNDATSDSGYGSAGSLGYGSAGSTSYGSSSDSGYGSAGSHGYGSAGSYGWNKPVRRWLGFERRQARRAARQAARNGYGSAGAHGY